MRRLREGGGGAPDRQKPGAPDPKVTPLTFVIPIKYSHRTMQDREIPPFSGMHIP